MTTNNKKISIPILDKERILSISLTYRGFGFIIFEDAKIIVDWGHASVFNHDPEIFEKRIATLIEYNLIETVLSYPTHRRPTQIQKNISSLKKICKLHGVKTKFLSKKNVTDTFEPLGAYTKYQRAGLIVEYLPELSYKLPPKRKPWQSEDLRMSIFDAACLALSYLYMKR
jgi:hypothetical protein